MNKHSKHLLTVLAASLLLLGACGSSADGSNTAGDEQISMDEENSSEAQIEEPTSEESEPTSTEEEQSTQSNGTKKDTYLKKLNEMEEEDRHAQSKSTTAEMIEQETQRYEKWDQELNEIYALLIEQLSPEEMEPLREEQREWIVQRDQTAKESSLQYQGGSMEPLEYVATQAELTRERCYLLVARYMN